MGARKSQSFDFKVNVDFVTKAQKGLDSYVTDLKEIQKIAGNRLGSSFIDNVIGDIKPMQKNLNTLIKTLNDPKLKQSDKIKLINSSGEELKYLNTLMKKLDSYWKSELKQSSEYEKQLDVLISKRRQLATLKAKITKNSNSTNQANESLNSLGYTDGTTKKDLAGVNSEVRNIMKTISSNKEKGIFDNKDLEAELDRLKKIAEQIQIIIGNREKNAGYGKEMKNLTAIDGKAGTTDPDTATKRLDSAIADTEKLTEATEKAEELSVHFKEVETNAAGATDNVENFSAEGQSALTDFNEKTEEAKQNVATIKQLLAQFGIGISAVQVANYFKDLATSAFEFYKSLDSALNQIYIVSDLSSKAVMNLKDDFIQMSKESGMAIDDITESAVLFYQQGLSTNEVLQMTEVTAQFAKVAGIDATDAADKLTAAVNGYCLAAEDASFVADKFNKVAAASAADINELSTAFSKAAAQANQAGVSMDNYLAYIATMEEATREAPENIGTSLKTIFSRMEQIKNAGSSEDGETDVNNVETALKSVGVQLRNSENQLRDLEDVLDELGTKWNTLDVNTQAYLGTIIAGTRQQSRFITLMQNWDRVLDLSEESENSAGQQALMHQKAMESLSTAVEQMNNAWQTFLSNLTDSSVFKNVINLVTNFLNVINKGKAPIMLLNVALLSLTTRLTKLGGTVVSSLAKKFNNLKKSVAYLITTFTKNGKSMEQIKNEYVKTTKVIDNYAEEIKESNVYTKATKDAMAQATGGVDQLDVAIKQLDLEIDNLSGAQKNHAIEMRKALVDCKTATQEYNAMTQAISSTTSIATGFVGILTTIVTALGLTNTTTGQLIIGLGSLGAAVTVLAVVWITAHKMMAAGVKTLRDAILETGIGAILVAIGLLLTGIINVVEAFTQKEEKAAQAINDSVDSIKQNLDSISTAKTAIKGTESLIKKYEELNSKVYRTKKEQEELNETIQSLAESYDLEVITDKYGNLSINIADVNEKLAEQKEELAQLEDDLATEEKKGQKDNKFQLNEYYDKLFSKQRSKYKELISGIDSDIDTDKLEISAQKVANVSTNLKNAIMNNAEEQAYWLGKQGKTVSTYIKELDAELNAKVDDNAWELFYTQLNEFDKQVDDLSYADMQKKLDEFFEEFQKQCGLTTEQVELLREAMNSTLYGDGNLDKTISSLEKSIDKQALMADKQKEIDEKYKKHWYDYVLSYGTGGMWDLTGLGTLTNTGSFSKDGNKLYSTLNSAIEIQGMDTSDVEALIASLERLTAASDKGLSAIDAYSDILDKEGNVIVSAQDFLTSLNIDSINDAFKNSDAAGIEEIISQLSYQIEHADSDELKKALQDKINDAMGQLSITAELNWKGLGDELDSITTDLRKMNSIMDEFNNNGGISLDTFQDLCDLLDNIDIESLFQTGMIDEYINALDKLNLGIDASTGYLTAEGEAMESLQTIQEVMAKAQIEATIQKLKNTKASLQAELDMVEVEKQATLAAIDYLKTKGNSDVALADIEKEANNAYIDGMATAVDAANSSYQAMTKASAEWAQASIKNAGKVSEAINKAYTGELSADGLNNMLSNIQATSSWEGLSSSGIRGLSSNGKTVNATAAIDQLNSYVSKLDNTENAIKIRMKSIDAMIVGLEDMKDKDLGKLGAEGKDDTKELEKYIGKLEEIYNILRKIEGAEARLGNLSDYLGIAQGKDYANYLKEEIQLTDNLTDSYTDLLKAQKFIENTEQAAIKGSPVGDVFSFDEFGNIIVDYQKYTKLQDTAISGEKSLKELADELYEEYKDLHSTTLEYYDKLIENVEKAIDAQQTLIDTYVDLENSLANALKDVYQKMLDNRLDAIDKEIDALDKLKEAYQDARKAQSDSKELSKLQTGLKRSMMDTSGASNTKVLSYQDQLKEKLENMGEDQYTKRLDGITEALNNEKEMLQQEFDKYFEDWKDFHKLVEQRILPNQEAVNDLLMTTDEYKTATEAERKQMIQDWETKYNTAMLALEDGGSIMDVVDQVSALKGFVNNIDGYLKDNKFAEEIGTGVSRVLEEYYKPSNNGSSNSSSSSGGSGGSGSYTSTYTPVSSTTTTDSAKPKALTSYKTDDQSSGFNLGDKIKEWWEKVKEFFSNVGTAISDFFTKTIPEKWGQFTSWLSEKIGKYFTLDYWSNKFNTIGQSISNFFTVTIPEKWNAFTAWLQENFGKYFTSEYWSEKFYNIGVSIGEFLFITIPNKIDELKAWWNTNVAKFFTKEYWKTKLENIGKSISDWWAGVEEWWNNTVVAWFKEKVLPKLTKEYWAEKIENIGKAISEWWTGIGEWWNDTVVKWFKEDFLKIFTKEYWTEKINNIGKAIKEWWTGIKSWWDSTVGAWYRQHIAPIFTKDYWIQKVENIKNGFISGIKGIANTLIDIFNGLVGGIAKIWNASLGSLINGIASVYGTVSGKDVGDIGKVDYKPIEHFLHGGLADFTGPAWLDGSKSAPEAVLNAEQTKAFLKLADNIDKFDGVAGNGIGESNISIGEISFQVDSMSSVEDGEIAFDTFVEKFKEIGSRTGLKINA